VDAVSFEGWLSRSDVAEAYRSATVLVQLSRYEGMSNTVLEALASGLPVVASRVPGNIELIEPDGNDLLFDLAEDVTKIARAIVHLYKNPDLRQQLSNRARQRVISNYSWDRIAEMFENQFS